MDEIEIHIRRVVPATAVIEALTPSGFDDAVYRVCWNLNDDPGRPNKKSKTIAIHVPYEMVQDLPNIPAARRSLVSDRLHQFLVTKFATFDPNHTAGRNTPPPVEDWTIPPQAWSV